MLIQDIIPWLEAFRLDIRSVGDEKNEVVAAKSGAFYSSGLYEDQRKSEAPQQAIFLAMRCDPNTAEASLIYNVPTYLDSEE